MNHKLKNCLIQRIIFLEYLLIDIYIYIEFYRIFVLLPRNNKLYINIKNIKYNLNSLIICYFCCSNHNIRAVNPDPKQQKKIHRNVYLRNSK